MQSTLLRPAFVEFLVNRAHILSTLHQHSYDTSVASVKLNTTANAALFL